ncbi:MAG: hypothetical protein EBZ48_06930, partial [Proteobacteria bacterium]|nr:hypothetical protein [Pseudomonadota bacterium]
MRILSEINALKVKVSPTRVGLTFGILLFHSITQSPAAPISPTLSGGGPGQFSFQGKLYFDDGFTPVMKRVSFLVQIYDPTGQCLLFEEQPGSLDLSLTQGAFSIKVGSEVGSARRTGQDPGLSMIRVLSNRANQPLREVGLSNCPQGYTPASGDSRKVRVIIQPEGESATTLSPDYEITSIPYAAVAETLQGLTPQDVIQRYGPVSQATLTTLTQGDQDASTLHHHDSRYLLSGSTQAQNLGSGVTSSGGQIGIGTQTPSFDLGLGGTKARSIGVERSAVGDGFNLTLSAGGATQKSENSPGGSLVLKAGASTGNRGSSIEFQTSHPSDPGETDNPPLTSMIISELGRVGIGENTPSARLEVKPQGGELALKIHSSESAPNAIELYDSNSNKVSYFDASGNLYLPQDQNPSSNQAVTRVFVERATQDAILSANVDQYIKKDGSTPLLNPWVSGKKITSPELESTGLIKTLTLNAQSGVISSNLSVGGLTSSGAVNIASNLNAQDTTVSKLTSQGEVNGGSARFQGALQANELQTNSLKSLGLIEGGGLLISGSSTLGGITAGDVVASSVNSLGGVEAQSGDFKTQVKTPSIVGLKTIQTDPLSGALLSLPSSVTDTLVGRQTQDTLKNKTLSSESTSFKSQVDSTLLIDLAGLPGKTTTLRVAPSSDQLLTLPNESGTLATQSYVNTTTQAAITQAGLGSYLLRSGASPMTGDLNLGGKNLINSNNITASGGISAVNGSFLGSLSAGGALLASATVTNLLSVGSLNSQGSVTGGEASFSSLTSQGGIQADSLSVTNSISGGSLSVSGGLQAQSASISGSLQAGASLVASLVSLGQVSGGSAVFSGSVKSAGGITLGGSVGQIDGLTKITRGVNTLTLPQGSDTLIGKQTQDVLENKSLVDSSTRIVKSGDPSNSMALQVQHTGGYKTVIQSDPAQSSDVVITLPQGGGTLVDRTYVDSKALQADNLYVKKSGDVMTGSLVGNLVGVASGNLPLSGGSLSGALSLSGDPTSPMHATNKQYVDLGLSTKEALLSFNSPLQRQDNTISIPQASLSSSGYLSSGDWAMFNNKLNKELLQGSILVGGVDGQATSVQVSGDATLSSSGALSLASTGVQPGTYRSVGVDSKGRVYSGSNPTTLSGYGITDALTNSLGSGQIFIGNPQGQATQVSLSGDVLLSGTGVTTVSRVGGVVSGDIFNSTQLTKQATNLPLPGTLMKRDEAGSVSVGVL